ncbi:MAG: hypothetical protein Q9159_002100 [Coniocarpon cinnabarinum]
MEHICAHRILGKPEKEENEGSSSSIAANVRSSSQKALARDKPSLIEISHTVLFGLGYKRAENISLTIVSLSKISASATSAPMLTHSDPLMKTLVANMLHCKPVADNAEAIQEFESNMREPRNWSCWSEKLHSSVKHSNCDVPFSAL